MTTEDILAILRQVKYDLSVTQTRVGEALAALAALPSTPNEELECPECGAHQRGRNTLAEHRYNVHGGPVPEHYLAAERWAGIL